METTSQIDDVQELQRIERKRRDTLCRAACATVTVLLVVFAVKDAATGHTLLSAIVSVFAGFNLIVMLLHDRYQKLEAFSAYLVMCSVSLLLYLLCTGGSGNSGIVWLPAFPLLMYSVLTSRIASVLNSSIFVISALILLIPDNPLIDADYGVHLTSAGLGSYALIGFFTYYQAREREAAAASIAYLNVELRQIASTDELTQLSNRRDISLRLEFESKRAQRSGKHFSIILCDIDYFKRINDSFGHSVGDQALQAFAKLLESRFRETDKVGRWGGEEFLVILPDTSLSKAITIANEVRLSICKASLIENMPNRLVTMSAGVACSSETDSYAELVRIADRHMYEAKNAGRNRVKPDA